MSLQMYNRMINIYSMHLQIDGEQWSQQLCDCGGVGSIRLLVCRHMLL